MRKKGKSSRLKWQISEKKMTVCKKNDKFVNNSLENNIIWSRELMALHTGFGMHYANIR